MSLSLRRTTDTVRRSSASKRELSGSAAFCVTSAVATSSASVVFRAVEPCRFAPHSTAPKVLIPLRTQTPPVVDFVSTVSPPWSASAKHSRITVERSSGWAQ